MRSILPIFTAVLPLAMLAACSADSGYTSADERDAQATPTDVSPPGNPGPAPTDRPGEEVEDDFLAMPPAQTDVYVFVANPSRDTVTRVKVDTLDVHTVAVGRDPTLVRTTPDYTHAVAFNRGDDTVTLIDADTLETRTVEVRDNLNAMVMSPDGSFVALWHDQDAERPDDPPVQGLLSFNEVSFVEVETGTHIPMAVEFNPRNIKFTPDASIAVVVSDRALAVVDLLASPLVPPNIIPVAQDVLQPPPAEEVVLSHDGAFAFVRQAQTQELVVVDLITEQVDYIPVGLDPTDLDMDPQGKKAVVVSRGARQIWEFSALDPYRQPVVHDFPEDLPLGAIRFTPDGTQAIVYTTASSVDRYIAWDTETGDLQTYALVKPVRSLSITPAGNSMLIFHTIQDAPEASASNPFFGQWALTMVDLAEHLSYPILMPAEPIGFANGPTGRYGYFIMDGQPYLEILDYHTRLYEQVQLRSSPVYVGALPDLTPGDGDEPMAWVSQEHPLGRITFYDADDETLETLTGFELNSLIED